VGFPGRQKKRWYQNDSPTSNEWYLGQERDERKGKGKEKKQRRKLIRLALVSEWVGNLAREITQIGTGRKRPADL
jgi:hypothetical protein